MDTPSDLELWIKIIGGAIAAFVALIGIPAAFLQFGKTRAEIRKLRLEAQKLTSEINDNGAGTQSSGYEIAISESPGTIITIQTDPSSTASMLIIIDFIVAYITFQAISIALGFLFGFLPFGYFTSTLAQGFRQIILLVAFAALFLPVFSNGRQLRGLLRDIAARNERAGQKQQ